MTSARRAFIVVDAVIIIVGVLGMLWLNWWILGGIVTLFGLIWLLQDVTGSGVHARS
jgi:hypothetical protein